MTWTLIRNENSSVEVVKENTSFHNGVHDFLREIGGEQLADSKEVSDQQTISTLVAISTDNNNLAVIDSSLSIDDPPIWSGTIEYPTEVLHNILT